MFDQVAGVSPVFTIGHSNHALERFLELLSGAGVTAVADVRSQPVSRFAPQFNGPALCAGLEARGVRYVFLGRELGGRPKDEGLLTGGKPDHAKMARAPAFGEGIARIGELASRHRFALMCAERDPVNCHRFLLIARHLAEAGVAVAHILADGSIETQDETERRLRAARPQADLLG